MTLSNSTLLNPLRGQIKGIKSKLMPAISLEIPVLVYYDTYVSCCEGTKSIYSSLAHSLSYTILLPRTLLTLFPSDSLSQIKVIYP